MNVINKKYLPLIISTATASFMVNLDTYIINVAIPAITQNLNIPKADVLWVITAYNLVVVSLLLIFGKLADRIGLKKLFMIGFIIFTSSSLFCAISQNITQLIISRILQGIGASILYALPQAIIGKFLPKEQRGMGFGLSASAAALGIMLGSPISGLLTGLLSWHWIFLINLPIGIFIICLILNNSHLFTETSENKEISNSKFDFIGSVLSFLSVLGLTLWLNRLNSLGFSNYFMIILLILSLFLSVTFIRHCLKEENPLVDLTLFKNKYFTAGNISMFLISAFLAGNNFLIPYYFYEIKHLSELKTGIIFVIYSISYMTFSLLYGKISNKIPAAKISTFASILSSFAILFFILCINQSSIIYTAFYFILLGISFSFFITSNNNFIMSQAKENNAGAIAGLHRMTGRLGMLFGTVIFEFIFSFFGKINLYSYIYTYVTGLIICLFAGIMSFICIKDKQKS